MLPAFLALFFSRAISSKKSVLQLSLRILSIPQGQPYTSLSAALMTYSQVQSSLPLSLLKTFPSADLFNFVLLFKCTRPVPCCRVGKEQNAQVYPCKPRSLFNNRHSGTCSRGLPPRRAPTSSPWHLQPEPSLPLRPGGPSVTYTTTAASDLLLHSWCPPSPSDGFLIVKSAHFRSE